MLAKVAGKDTRTVVTALIKQAKKLPKELYNTKFQQLRLVDDSQISFALIHWWRTMEVRHAYSSIVARGLRESQGHGQGDPRPLL
jgi:hypothetical protein